MIRGILWIFSEGEFDVFLCTFGFFTAELIDGRQVVMHRIVGIRPEEEFHVWLHFL